MLLDVDPETARERFTEAPDRLESEPPEFHARVRSGFLTLAAADPTRYLVVDAGQDPEAITTVVRHRLDQLLPLSEAEIKAQEEARKAAEEEARRKAEEEAARKAEEERLERERQEQLAKLRAEEEERKARELEEARRREAERQAEEARQRAEEARRVAEEERVRREAEEAAREAEQARLRRQAEEEARLRKEAEALRLEKQRKAEEALLRAEEARRRAEAEAAAAAEKARAEAAAAASVPESEITVPTPIVNPNDVTQQVPAPDSSPSDEAETAMIPKIHDRSGRAGGSGAAGAADETTVLPPVRETNPADRIPRGIFRDERPVGSAPESENERTRELPQVGGWEDQQHPEHRERSGRRPRPEWAEETPLDDLPTLADELLGDHRDQPDDEGSGRSGRGRRPRR